MTLELLPGLVPDRVGIALLVGSLLAAPACGTEGGDHVTDGGSRAAADGGAIDRSRSRVATEGRMASLGNYPLRIDVMTTE